MDVYKDPERLMAERKSGPPDLRKPFTRTRTGKKKKPAEEEQPEENGIEDLLDDDGILDDQQDQQESSPPPQYQNNQPQYQPPPPTYQQPPAMQEQYQGDISQQIYELNTTKQSLEFQISNLSKLMTVFKKYLVYHRQLIKDTESVIEQVAEVSSGVSAKIAPAPVSHPLPTVDQEDRAKKKKRMTILMSGLGLVFLLGAFYLGAIIAGLPTMGVLAFIVAGLGGGFLAVGLRG